MLLTGWNVELGARPSETNMGEPAGDVISERFSRVLLNKHCQTSQWIWSYNTLVSLSKDRRVTKWAMAAFCFPKTAPNPNPTMVARNHDSLCLLPMSNYGPTQTASKSETRQGLEKSRRYKVHKQQLSWPSPQISLICVLFHSIATTYNHRN